MPRLSRLGRRALKTRQGAIAIIAVICFITGIIAGAVALISRGAIEQASIAAELASHITSLAGHYQAPDAQEILQNFVSNLIFVAVIWVLAFARTAGFLSFMVVMLQGASYGFTTAALVAAFGIVDGLAATLVYLPQALILAPTLLYVCTSSVKYVCLTRGGRPNSDEASLRRYTKTLAIAAIFAAFATLLDVYLSTFVARQLF